MEIKLLEIKVSDLVEGFADYDEGGVVSLNGRLNIRPKYQREFVYSEELQKSVIDSIMHGYPLNLMYWVLVSGEKFDSPDATYEILDGQQRTLSICNYKKGKFSWKEKYYGNLTSDEKKKIDDYKLSVYVCTGDESEKLAWFEIINKNGLELKPQERRNAIYAGTWLSDAKKYFSKVNGPAYGLGSAYLNGECNRQAYLESVIKWISNGNINDYMGIHKNDANASVLWQYFQSVISWVKATFIKYRKEMKGVEWGFLYNQYKNQQVNAVDLEERIKKLMMDDDVTRKSGIYEYVFDGEEKHLSIRAFTESMKRSAYEKQNGICPICGQHFEFDEMEGDHKIAWHAGGKTNADNCQMLCKHCNAVKSGY